VASLATTAIVAAPFVGDGIVKSGVAAADRPEEDAHPPPACEYA
jgi:hypothetical protein